VGFGKGIEAELTIELSLQGNRARSIVKRPREIAGACGAWIRHVVTYAVPSHGPDRNRSVLLSPLWPLVHVSRANAGYFDGRVADGHNTTSAEEVDTREM
jgi:prepilin-type processing-associated H-X9-DG protein